MKQLTIFGIIFACGSLCLCSSPNSPQTKITRSPLLGTWEEEFTQQVRKEVTYPEDTECCYPVAFVSRITFLDSTYQSRLSAPEFSRLTPLVDSGSYKIAGDTLILVSPIGQDQTSNRGTPFSWSIKRGKLVLACMSSKVNDSVIAMPMTGMFWATQALFGVYSVTPNCSGEFVRTK